MLHVFLRHLRNITCTSFLSFLVSSALASQALDDEAPRWLNAFAHCQTAVAYNKMQFLVLSHQGLPRSKLSPHFHQNCTHGALQSPCTVQRFVAFSLTAWVEWHCNICTFFHRNLSSLNLLWDIRVFFQRSFSCKSFWCTAAAVHDVMHFVQHWNHPCWRWCWLMIMCGGCFGGDSRSRRCCLQVSAESATTETTSLVLMPCSTEHSGVPFISVEYVMLHWVTLTIVFYIEI